LKYIDADIHKIRTLKTAWLAYKVTSYIKLHCRVRFAYNF